MFAEPAVAEAVRRPATILVPEQRQGGNLPAIDFAQRHQAPRQSAEPGRDQLERPVAITWNRWSRSPGIGGRDQLDSVVAITWNTAWPLLPDPADQVAPAAIEQPRHLSLCRTPAA
jgi:hypothetical protein